MLIKQNNPRLPIPRNQQFARAMNKISMTTILILSILQPICETDECPFGKINVRVAKQVKQSLLYAKDDNNIHKG